MPEQMTSDTASFTPPIPVVPLEELSHYFVLRNRDAVVGFLESHPELIRPVLEAYTHIQAVFPDAQAFLDVDIDGDLLGQHQQLVVAIATDVDAHAAVTRLRTFDFDWWLTQPASKTGLLLFTVE